MQFRLLEVALAEIPCRTRMPFRFGNVTLEQAPLLHARVLVEAVDGRRGHGLAADLLVPQWFRKDPTRTPAEDQEELRASAAAAAHALSGSAAFGSVFDLWWALYQARVAAVPPGAPDRLVRGFGTALLERALIDAACRLQRKSFWSALRADLFGFEPERLCPELQGWRLPDGLPDRPRTRIAVRHTVGMLDPLATADAPASPVDGEPRSLEEELRTRGLRWLKVKIGAGADRERLLAIARLLAALDCEAQVTLDGNEQFHDLGELAQLLSSVAADPDGRRLLQRLRAIEQPLPRASTFADDVRTALPTVAAFAPLLIDEADDGPEAFPRALALGYRGVSVKNCKGVFRALANLGLCRARGEGAFLSAEDLTNLPVVSLQQDLATVAALGLDQAERNGHHYFPGLDHLPAAVVQAALAAHPDLYEAAAGRGRLRIGNGELACASLLGPGYGVDEELAAVLTAALPWRHVAGD